MESDPDSAVPAERISAEPRASSEEWLAGTAAGDPRAFEMLYRHYAPRILAFLRRKTSDPAVLGDLLQDVFLAVWRKAALFQPHAGTADQWMFAIARHRLYDAWRQAARLKEDVLESDEVPHARGDSRESDLEMSNLVDKLEPKQKQAVRVFYYDGLSLEEGAARLRTPVGTLKSRLHKALKRLRILVVTEEAL